MRSKTGWFAGCAVLALLFVAGRADATLYYIYDQDQLINAASVIVAGDVVDVSSVWLDDPRVIITTAAVRVTQVDKGGRLQKNDIIYIRTPGGSVDGDALAIPGFPTYREGESLYLFLKAVDEQHYVPIGGVQGKLNLFTDDETGRRYIGGLPTPLAGVDAQKTKRNIASGAVPPALNDLADEKGKVWLQPLRRRVLQAVEQQYKQDSQDQ